jgi:hypothetical protein
MPSHLSPSARPSSMPWGFALAALSVLLVGGGLIVWAHQDPAVSQYAVLARTDLSPAPPYAPLATTDVPSVLPGRPPLPPDAVAPPALNFYSITLTHEHGTRVVKIQVVAGGDEIIVDAASGKVLETRPGPALPPRAAVFSSAT